MSQKYQVDNLTSRFIKSLLYDTYIPTVDIWRPGKPLIKGMTYITNDKYIVVAKKDFTPTIKIENEEHNYNTNIQLNNKNIIKVIEFKVDDIIWPQYEYFGNLMFENFKVNNKLGIVYDIQITPSTGPYPKIYVTYTVPNISPQSALNEEYFQIIEPYIEGKFYPGITSNFKSNSSLYDSDTHYMLGQYLRMLRDLYDLDLMPYYNCFDGTTSDKIRIELNNNIESLIKNNEIDDGLISYIVPIKFNKQYSIYYNSNVPFRVKPIYYDGITLSSLKDISNNTEIKSTLIKYCSLTSPYILSPIERLAQYDMSGNNSSKLIEDYLCLLIQVPKNNSPLIVLEGNYKNININNKDNINYLPEVLYGDKDDILQLTEEEINNILKPYSSLLYKPTDMSYAFNDRLVEYLLLSPIINKDKVRDNIRRIQEYLTSEKAKKEFGHIYPYTYKKDIWDNLMRLYIYNLVIKDKKNPLYLDINGFVDKDSEFIIDRGKQDGGSLNV